MEVREYGVELMSPPGGIQVNDITSTKYGCRNKKDIISKGWKDIISKEEGMLNSKAKWVIAPTNVKQLLTDDIKPTKIRLSNAEHFKHMKVKIISFYNNKRRCWIYRPIEISNVRVKASHTIKAA